MHLPSSLEELEMDGMIGKYQLLAVFDVITEIIHTRSIRLPKIKATTFLIGLPEEEFGGHLWELADEFVESEEVKRAIASGLLVAHY